MLTEVTCRQVFLASPGGLDAERTGCRDVFRQHNETRSIAERTFFYLHAWEDVPGGVGRPQDLINARLGECDYAVIIFHDRWGSPPSNDGRYTSGTEEEFYRALELLADAGSPMRDILVLFKLVDPRRVADAGPDLKAVLDFRASIEDSKHLMYETFDSEAALGRVLERKMREWLDDRSPKQAKRISMAAAQVDTDRLRVAEPAELIQAARDFARDGHLVQAEAAFSSASRHGNPRYLLEFGQFMRRTGRLDQAIVLNQAVVSNPELLVSEAAQAVALRVRAMANIGIIRRQLGELAESIRLLKEAARTADASLEPIPEDQCYALDNYGHSLLRAGWAKLALDQFERVRLIREDFGSEDDRIQSAINLARYHASQAEFDQALGHFERALGMLNTESDPHLRANAEAGKVEALLRLGRESEVDALLDSALGLNEDLHNKRGAGIVHGLWARTWLLRGRPNEAEPHIASARELADETGDAQGQAVVEWLQAASALQRGNPQEAREKAAEAKRSLSSSADMALRSDLESLLEAVSESGTTGGWAIGSM